MIQGGCLCGAVRYEARGAPLGVGYCHCRSCRHHTGAPVVAYVEFAAQHVRFSGAGRSTYASSPGVPLDKMPGGPAFTEKYTTTFNQEIQIYAPYAYDATNTLIAAITQADSTDPAVYLPVLAGIEHEGVSGIVRFDEKGDIRGGSISLYKVSEGQWQYIETVGGGA